MAITFRVFGVPAPQGSKRASVGKSGKAHMYEQSAKTLKPWREAISDAGARVMDGRDPLDGPLFVDLTFFMKRPAKPLFKDYPATPIDIDKASRGVNDALKTAGVIKDDSRIVEFHARKLFAATPEEQGVVVTAMSMAEWLAAFDEQLRLAR